tara:strand:- start:1978 stop:2709 length:732 start_codon:yes stop_codon:yes gene_type:complete
MGYEDNTVNSVNPLARFAHRSRYGFSLSMIEGRNNINLLDFGCGDGTFLGNARDQENTNAYIGFEPYMESIIKEKDIKIYPNWSDIQNIVAKNGKFDVVTCFEVMEHFSEERQITALENIKEILKEDGNLIISVPIEKGLPVIPKNLRRIAISYRGNENIYSFKNIIYSLFGIKSKSIKSLRVGNDYLSHMGFYFTDLETLLKKYFNIESINYSPFPIFPYFFNSQVFYKLSLNNKKNTLSEK